MIIIKIIKYVILGLVQGFTEPLPISSSAHLIIASHYLGLDVSLNFEILIHFASLLAILYFFRTDILQLFSSIIHPKDKANEFKMIQNIIIASIPAIILGFLFKNYIETKLNSLTTAALLLLVTSVILVFTSLIIDYGTKETPSKGESIIIGLFQAMALIPGISRSAATLLGTKVCKLHTKEALKFSFYLYLVASFGAFVLSLKDFTFTSQLGFDLITFVVAFFATLKGISFLYRIISTKSLIFFSIYTLIISIVIFLTK